MSTVGSRVAIGAAVLSALLLWAASPSVGAGWLAWFALVPVAWVALRWPGRAGRLVVPLAYALYLELLLVPALPFGLADGQWGDPAVPVLVGGSPVLVVGLVAVPLLGVALYAIDFGRPWPRSGTRSGSPVLRVIGPALVWTGLEVGWVKLLPGAAWGPLYLSQAEIAPSSLAALAGPWLATLAIVAVNYGLALALVRRRPFPALVPAAGAAAAIALGLWAQAGSREDRLDVAAVQPGYDTAEEDRRVLRHFEPGSYDRAALDLIRDLAPATRRAASGGAELVIWPEATLYVDPRVVPDVRRALLRLRRRSGADLVVPFFARDGGRTSEALGVIAARLTAPRAKQRPLWFLGERAGRPSAATPLDVGGLEIGLLLGSDGLDPGLAAGLAHAGADLLVAPTHDWEALALQQRAAARLAARAVGLPLVRADWRFGSAAYGTSGDVIADTGEELARTTAVARLAPGSAATPYARIGDAGAWVALAASAMVLLLGRGPFSTRRRRTRAGPTALGIGRGSQVPWGQLAGK